MILDIFLSYKKQAELLETKVQLIEKKLQLETESKELWKQEARHYAKQLTDALNLLDQSTGQIKIHTK